MCVHVDIYVAKLANLSKKYEVKFFGWNRGPESNCIKIKLSNIDKQNYFECKVKLDKTFFDNTFKFFPFPII